MTPPRTTRVRRLPSACPAPSRSDAATHTEEHAEIKELIYKADTTSVDHAQYDEVITKAVTFFLTHAKEEEDEQHGTIRSRLSPQDNDVRLLLQVWAYDLCLFVDLSDVHTHRN